MPHEGGSICFGMDITQKTENGIYSRICLFPEFHCCIPSLINSNTNEIQEINMSSNC